MRIDFHAHILPGVDHGSSSVESSIIQLKRAKDVGIDVVVAMPHFYPDQSRLKPFLERRADAFNQLLPVCNDMGIRCILGAEVALCEGLENLEGIEELCIAGTKCMLIEMPFRQMTARLLNTLDDIKALGIIPVLAHIDRYPRANVIRALELGVAAQLNTDAFKGIFSRSRYLHCVDDGIVQALGSDTHEDREDAYKSYEKALNTLGKKREAILMKRMASLLNIV